MSVAKEIMFIRFCLQRGILVFDSKGERGCLGTEFTMSREQGRKGEFGKYRKAVPDDENRTGTKKGFLDYGKPGPQAPALCVREPNKVGFLRAKIARGEGVWWIFNSRG